MGKNGTKECMISVSSIIITLVYSRRHALFDGLQDVIITKKLFIDFDSLRLIEKILHVRM